MARSNKYAAINFNEIYGPKRPTSSSSSSPSSSSPSSPSQNTPLSSARTHGRMLILTRPSKPQTPPPTRTPPEKPPALTPAEPDSISLRPLTRTAAAAAAAKNVKESPPPLTPPKPEPFVPPHLRPGFAGREERPQPEVQREKQGFRPRGGDDEGRPRSGGGYEGMRRGGLGLDMERNRPGSGGNRPSPSGWNGYYRSPPSHFDDRV
ncbi:hypothetical protein AAC387_Pa06g0287 [Persea americana]